MKLTNVALVSLAFALASIGCSQTVENPDARDEEGTLDTAEEQLVEDDAEATETDDDLEAGLDEPLSGASEDDPGNPADGASEDEVLEKARTNPGRFFRPAGCLVSTRERNVIRHEFNGCTGPYEMREFNGTVRSTYEVERGKLTVTHEADGLSVNGATVTGKRVVVYTREGTLVRKTRSGSWSGTTAKGRPIRHEASFVTTYDAARRCITRDGSARTTIGERSFERTIDGYERCGIGRGGCPERGSVTLTRTKDGSPLSLSIDFLGGARYRVTRPNGEQATRLLICRPNAG